MLEESDMEEGSTASIQNLDEKIDSDTQSNISLEKKGGRSDERPGKFATIRIRRRA